jgi:hypothetical protein
MKLLREIPLELVKQGQLNQLEQFGFTLIYLAASILVMVEG